MTEHGIAGDVSKVMTDDPRAVWRRILEDESGQDLIEYALVAALVGLGAVASMKTLSTKIGTAFTTIGTSLTSNV